VITDNGILAAVPGHLIGGASRTLPDPATAPDDELTAEVDAGDVGRVRIAYRRRRIRHGRSSHWAWLAVSAEKV
jgi:hypothetical protein